MAVGCQKHSNQTRLLCLQKEPPQLPDGADGETERETDGATDGSGRARAGRQKQCACVAFSSVEGKDATDRKEQMRTEDN